MGANISGAGTDEIIINGVDDLDASIFTIPADRIEAGTYLVGAAVTYGDITIQNINANRMNNILDRVENGEGSIGKLVNNNDLVDNMNGFIDDLRLLLEDFSENTEEYLKKYIRANKKVKKEK